jgi:hypothetical protein
VEKELLEKRLEAEEEMWNLWKMGEDDDTMTEDDTDFICRYGPSPIAEYKIRTKIENEGMGGFQIWFGKLLEKIVWGPLFPPSTTLRIYWLLQYF